MLTAHRFGSKLLKQSRHSLWLAADDISLPSRGKRFRLICDGNPAHTRRCWHLPSGFSFTGLEYLTEIPAATCVLVCSLVMARIEKISLSDYGLSLHHGAGKHFLWGLFWGLCVFSAMILVVAALHASSSGTSRARSFEVCKLMGDCLSAGRIRGGIPLSRLCAVYAGASHRILAGRYRLVPRF